MADAERKEETEYTCPMHPEVRQIGPGACPKCGMALEPASPQGPPPGKGEYTCPMHPEIVRKEPGNCPICGMALEPRSAISAEEGESPELADMRRKLWVSLAFTVPLVIIAMRGFFLGQLIETFIPMRLMGWLELLLATPVVLWGGWPFFVRAVHSVFNRSPNMFTLIGLGVSMAYGYSLAALFFPGIFPSSFRDERRNRGNLLRGCGGDR